MDMGQFYQGAHHRACAIFHIGCCDSVTGAKQGNLNFMAHIGKYRPEKRKNRSYISVTVYTVTLTFKRK